MLAPSKQHLVLVVDDEPTIREVLGAMFTDEGYRVHCAADGQEALDYLVLHRPAVIVSDIKMPRMHGLALVERVRAEGLATPIVLISTWVPPDLPGVHFVRKPFDLNLIMAVVEQSLTES